MPFNIEILEEKQMGMIANYRYINDQYLHQMKSFNAEEDDQFEIVEEEELLLDIDKMWDVLHFVLTGVGTSNPSRNDPLSVAVLGVTPLENVAEYIAYTEKTKVAEIYSALENFDMEEAMAHFSMQACKNADLYPDIWDYDDEEEEIKEEICEYFQAMKDFYKKILELNGNVMVTIC